MEHASGPGRRKRLWPPWLAAAVAGVFLLGHAGSAWATPGDVPASPSAKSPSKNKKRKRKRSHRRKSKGKHAYRGRLTVTGNTPTLGEVAMYLYGKARFATEIARWNHLRKPYRVYTGMKLILKRKPTLTPEEGITKILNMWRERLDAMEGEPPGEEPARENALVPSGSPELRRQEPRAVTPETLIADGQRYLNAGDSEKALACFRKSRELDRMFLPPWFLELKLLLKLGRENDARETARGLVAQHPETRGMEIVRRLLPAEPATSEPAPAPSQAQPPATVGPEKLQPEEIPANPAPAPDEKPDEGTYQETPTI